MGDDLEFRMEPRLRVVQSVGYLIVLLVSTPMLVLARGDRLLPLLVWGLLACVIVVLIVGVNRARLVLDPAQLTVFGVFGTRVLPRERVVGLMVMSGSVILGWRTERGRERAWPLGLLYSPGLFARFVPGAHERRQEFVDRVNAWVASAPGA